MGMMEQMMSTFLGSDGQGQLSNGLSDMLRGLRMSYDKLCEIAAFTAPPSASKTRAGTCTGTGGVYDKTDKLVLPMRGKRIDLILYDNNAFVQWGQKAGAALNDETEYIAPGFYSLPASAGFVQIRAVSGGSAPRYSLTVWT